MNGVVIARRKPGRLFNGRNPPADRVIVAAASRRSQGSDLRNCIQQAVDARQRDEHSRLIGTRA
jgi:hypothetical protein